MDEQLVKDFQAILLRLTGSHYPESACQAMALGVIESALDFTRITNQLQPAELEQFMSGMEENLLKLIETYRGRVPCIPRIDKD
jgi:hypothetical protein